MPVQVYENYKDFHPPLDISKAVKRLVATVPSEYLVGLGSIILTNAAGSHSERTWRRRGEKWHSHNSYGVYHRATAAAAPWIELMVDNILAEWPPVLLRVAVVQDLAVGPTLYHEIGHHLGACIGGRRERESGAETWSRKLSRKHFRQKYWYLRPAIAPARFLVRTLLRIRDTLRRSRKTIE